jgi:hypothetical protein
MLQRQIKRGEAAADGIREGGGAGEAGERGEVGADLRLRKSRDDLCVHKL